MLIYPCNTWTGKNFPAQGSRPQTLLPVELQVTIHTEVVASVAQPEQVTSAVSNMLTFVFEVSQEHVADLDAMKDAPPRKVKRVLPASPEEAQKLHQFFPQT